MSEQYNGDLRTVLVTGATSGIGRATALALAEDGWSVVVHGRDIARGGATVKEIVGAGGNARFVAADLGVAEEVLRLIDEVGEVDALVNNGGFSWFGPTADLDAAGFDALFASNVRAAYLLVAGFAPGMVARGKGAIVNLASMAGQIGLAGGAAYGATKASLSSLTRSWAAEFSASGVRVNAVSPGPVYTGGADHGLTDALGQTTLTGRGAKPNEIAQVIAFLLSDKASYMTGATVPVDGGRTAV